MTPIQIKKRHSAWCFAFTYVLQFGFFALLSKGIVERLLVLQPICGFDPCPQPSQPFSFTPLLIYFLISFIIAYLWFLYRFFHYLRYAPLSFTQQLLLLSLLCMISLLTSCMLHPLLMHGMYLFFYVYIATAMIFLIYICTVLITTIRYLMIRYG